MNAPTRSTGWIWAELLSRYVQAAKAGDVARVDELDALMAALEKEFPAEVQAEADGWRA